MAEFIQDLRYAGRTLRNDPGFTIAAVVALALGIGLNTSIFSVCNAVMLRPIPVKDPGTVVRLFRTVRGQSGAGVFSYPEYLDYRARSSVFSGVGAWSWTELTMGTSDRAERVSAMLVSGNYFNVLGAGAQVGRTFTAEEDNTAAAHPSIVLSYRFWQRRFAGDPAIVGRTVHMNGRAFTVIGVASRDFIGTDPVAPEAWVPLSMKATLAPGTENLFGDRNGHWLQVLARVKPGVSWAQARAAMDVLAAQLGHTYPEEKDSGVLLASATYMPPNVLKAATPIIVLLMGAVGLVLLIACANVANLMLARATARKKEVGIRVSLGATRGRLVRQLLTESLLISAISGLAGMLLAAWLPRAILNLVQPPFEASLEFNVSPDWRVIGYALAISAATAFLFGLAPALNASKAGVSEVIKTAILPRRRNWAAGIFVMMQVGFSVLLLAAAGLLVRALHRAQTTDPGFDMKHVLAFSLDLQLHRYEGPAAMEFERRVCERLEGVPGVKSASLAAIVPLGNAFMDSSVVVEGREPLPGGRPLLIGENVVSAKFFDTLSIPIVQGRGFEKSDEREGVPVAVVNESMARRFWPGQVPIGKRFKMGQAGQYSVIVGVARQARNSYLWDDDEPYFYAPMKSAGQNAPELKILVRTAGDPKPLIPILPEIIRGLDRSVMTSVKPLQENLTLWIWPSRVGALLATSFGVLALTLAALGIYGVVTYTVSRRIREIGIHIALGAQRSDVLRLVLARGMLLVAAGLAFGLAGAVVVSRLLSRFLYGLSSADPLTFGGVAAVLAVVAFAANYVPARRAIKVDPTVALRYE